MMGTSLRVILRLLAVLVIVGIVTVVLWLAWRPRAEDRDVLTGYIQADTLYLAAPTSGPVDRVFVIKGQRVDAGTPLFVMDSRSLTAASIQGQARMAQARAQIDQQVQALARAGALKISAQGQARNALDDLARDEAAVAQSPGLVSGRQIDAARATATTAVAQGEAADLDVKSAASRIEAAKALLHQETAALAQTQVQLDQLSIVAPARGHVEAVLFQSGEWAAANQPIVALIADSKIKVRFYVSQTELGLYSLGHRVSFRCDGCAPNLTAQIDYVSSRPEFTPPVIYSLKMRAKLVFMIEARPDRPETLSPGQPVDVTPLRGARANRPR